MTMIKLVKGTCPVCFSKTVKENTVRIEVPEHYMGETENTPEYNACTECDWDDLN